MTYTRTILHVLLRTWYRYLVRYVNYQTLVRVVWYSRAVQYMYCNTSTWYE